MSDLRSFENDMNRLQEIVNILENQNASLDDAINLCKEGVTLTNKCRKNLETASLQIEVLSNGVNDNKEK